MQSIDKLKLEINKILKNEFELKKTINRAMMFTMGIDINMVAV